MTAFEEELEKLEVYQELIDSELEDDNDWDLSISPEKQKAILAYGKRKSYLRISVLAVISTLMILPLCTLGATSITEWVENTAPAMSLWKLPQSL